MHIGTSFDCCLRSLGLLLVVNLSGCGQAARDSKVPSAPAGSTASAEVATDSAAEPFQIALHKTKTSAGALVASVDVFGINAGELAAIEKLDDVKRAALLGVYVADGEPTDRPAMLGSYAVIDRALRFTPRFPLDDGMRYRLVLHRDQIPGARGKKGGEWSTTFETTKPALSAPTVVEHVYPSANRLPENQLKFYLQFSAPMSRGESYRHIHLLDSTGKEIEAAFLELAEELWDPAMRRFTLLCDPGRVKRGLKPREELGPVLEEGKSYTLVVDRDWPDATGAALASTIQKSFDVGPPDETPIDPAAWKIEPPQAGSAEPLVVRFPEPIDHSLLERVLWVNNSAGEKLAGIIQIGDDETAWRFQPQQPWTAGDYQLVADTTLEDLAGNSIARAFDVDVFGPVQKKIETQTISIPFSVPPRESQ